MTQETVFYPGKTAKARTRSAKVIPLRGESSTFAEFPGMLMMLDGMRVYLASHLGGPRLFLVPRDGGFALCMKVSFEHYVWLIAERSKRVRIFKRLEAALSVCRQLAADEVIVTLKEPTANAEPTVQPSAA